MNFIATYRSISQASKKLGIKLSRIQRVCSGERKSVKGFIFTSDNYTISERKKSTMNYKRNQVVQCDLYGEKIAIFKTSGAAARHIGCSQKNIRRVLYGQQKSTAGFIFKYG